MKKGLRDLQKVCAIALAVVMLASPLLTPMAMAQKTTQDTAEQGSIDGKRDGKESTMPVAWMAIGCFTGGVSWIYPEFWETSVPKTPLLGKSPEYATTYEDAYRKARKKTIQTNSCIGGGIFYGSYAACCLLSAAASTPSSY
ncbi:hypothetical protein KKG61_07205 [bacterium]|nr:hypothetical protein [bacterium]MBU1599873.1 hypothetical protein [bacterium]MBU2461901.1 hypothetical protein [bacterium]